MKQGEIEKMLKGAHKVSLSAEEKDRLRAHLLEHIESSHTTTQVQNQNNWQYFFYRHSMSVAFVSILFFSGATSALAEFAFPGDVLYPVKTNVNEQVLGWFARNPQSQAEWQLSLAERRLKEVKYIAHDSKASFAVKELAEKKLNDQIQKIEMDGDTNLSRIATTLEADTQAMNAIPVKVSKTAESRMASMVAQKAVEDTIGTTTEKSKLDERRKKSEEKIVNLKKALSEKKNIKKDSLIRLKSELIISEKALLDSEMSGTGGNEEQENQHFERAETKIKDVESRLEDEMEKQ